MESKNFFGTCKKNKSKLQKKDKKKLDRKKSTKASFAHTILGQRKSSFDKNKNISL